ncbi:MAG TPA: hypothetical protein VE861_07600 [Gemmatimonadaceae bacterium]|nr:hypothetical protein [Gemmatimonadaceae bacterium]
MNEIETALDEEVAHVFAPLDKRALGAALALLAASIVAVVTVLSLVFDPERRIPLYLLSQYFVGYEISWRGAGIGALWALFIGFIWGWFLAFVRNFVMALWLIGLRVRADLTASRSFLDHI